MLRNPDYLSTKWNKKLEVGKIRVIKNNVQMKYW